MEEIWKDIKGYEGLYQISNLGNVKSLNRKIKNRKCVELIKKPSVLRGYLKVSLCKYGEIKYYFIHRLVAETFIPNPEKLSCVNHKDCNPSNNRVDNLEWCSYVDNNNYKNHNLKKNMSIVIHYLKKDNSNEKELIQLAEELRQKINLL